MRVGCFFNVFLYIYIFLMNLRQHCELHGHVLYRNCTTLSSVRVFLLTRPRLGNLPRPLVMASLWRRWCDHDLPDATGTHRQTNMAAQCEPCRVPACPRGTRVKSVTRRNHHCSERRIVVSARVIASARASMLLRNSLLCSVCKRVSK